MRLPTGQSIITHPLDRRVAFDPKPYANRSMASVFICLRIREHRSKNRTARFNPFAEACGIGKP
jgi:hypothetical protein